MSLHTINRSTRTRQGGGLPFYDKLDYVFSAINADFNSTTGLWEVPNNKLPTFQIVLDQEFITSFIYKETKGCNNFTGVTFTPPIGGVNITAIQVDGSQKYVFETSDLGSLVTPAPEGRWIIELVSNDGVSEFSYYSEEFVTKSCCG